MARLLLDYYKGETEYSDGDIESELLQIVKKNNNYEDVLRNDSRWPVVYHLSHLRQNILNWYPFKQDCEILEVGAGCGALTGALCDRAAHVTAVELTKRRAQIDFERNKGRNNLDIYVGDIFKMNFEGRFDYITVNGVLEYAAFMSKAEDPYIDFLNKVKSYLKPDGHILIAIENRFGLKYFSGAREDHTGKYFDGINGYDKDSRVRTFTKTELSNLLEKSGFNHKRFYYPLPDYKFPVCIMTDETINSFADYIDFGSHDNQRYELFNELKLTHEFAREGLLHEFANSFLIDAVCEEDAVIDDSVIMAKLSAARKPQYRIATIIEKKPDGEKQVIKQPLTQSCHAHLQKMADYFGRCRSMNGIDLVPCSIDADGKAVFEFARGTKFTHKIEEAIREAKKKAELDPLWKVLDIYREKLFTDAVVKSDFYNDSFISFFGEKRVEGELACVAPANIDLIFDNIFIDGDKFTAVDYEWIADFDVPAEYIFWRAILLSDIFKLHEDLREGIYEHYGITKHMKDTFFSWELSFSLSGIGGTVLHCEPSIKIDLNAIQSVMTQDVMTYSLCYDTGSGLDVEHPSLTGTGRMGETIFAKAKLEEDVNFIRFDPIEGVACQCRIISATCDDRRIKIRPLNNLSEDSGEELFFTFDPVYVIEEKLKKGSTLEIAFLVNKLDLSRAENVAEMKRVYNITRQNELEDELNNLRIKYTSLVNSKSWKITAPMRGIRGALNKNHTGNA